MTYTFAILHNGREVENLDPGTYATEAEARAAADDALDLCCPPGSSSLRYYRVDIRPVRHVADANARLIAAAPDLLAACEALVDIEGHQRGRCGYCGSHPSKHGPRCPLNLARAAIAKARGGA